MKTMVTATLICGLCSVFFPAIATAADTLPAPIVTGNSVEICLNSRYSQHSLNRTAATVQQMSNVLWAAGRAPVTGAYRRIYAATSAGTYLYDPVTHSLTWHSAEVASDGAFAIIYDAANAFDAGVMFMPAILASVSLGRSTEPAVASCPKGLGYPTTRLFFGVQAVKGLTGGPAASSSVAQGQPGWLPNPSADGEDSLEEVLADLRYVSRFSQENLTLQQISQILWAGYGCSAHMTTNGRAGLTVPSAFANYYLSGSIYLVNEEGVRRYQNRLPGANPGTRDHRLEALDSVGGRRKQPADGNPPPADVKAALRSAVGGLPEAPCYVILALDSSYVGQEYAQLEVGFVAGNMLVQASALELGCHFTPGLTATQRKDVQGATSMPVSHVPQVIVSLGPPLTSTPFEGDADRDGFVDLDDYVILSRSWLSSQTQAAYNAWADFDHDGAINMPDLHLLAANWLTTSRAEGGL